MWIGAVGRGGSGPARTLVAGLLLAVAYVLLGRLSFAVSVEHGNVTSVVFAPEGIALAFAVIFGRRVAWGVLIGQTVLSIWSGPSVLGGFGIGAVNTLECILGAALFARWRISPRFSSLRDVLLFSALVFLVLQPISATGGVTTLWAVGAMPQDWLPAVLQVNGSQAPIDGNQIASAWVHWWIGNSVGQLLFAALVLAWTIKGAGRRPETNADLLVSAVAIGLLAVTATAMPFYPLLMLGVTYPLLVWNGIRRGLRGITTAKVVIAPTIVWAAVASGDRYLDDLVLSDRIAYVGFFIIAAASVFSLALYATFEERRQLVDRLHDLARLDSLVPLANRRYFVERLESHLEQVTARGTPLAIVTFDVDHFKQINDDNGHAAGDLVLLAIADTCTALADGDDLAARIGGEEFAVALPGADLAAAGEFADRLRNAVAEQHLHCAQSDLTAVTISVGVTAARPDDSLDALLSRADDALYSAKRSGRNNVVATD